MGFKIVRNDIVKMNTEVIVNTANSEPAAGTGCDHAIYEAAGREQLLAYRREQIGHVEEGHVFITPAFNLKQKYIIHAVSPQYIDGNHGEEEKLHACYRDSLLLAKEHGVKSIAFPLISTGGFGYPKEEGIRIAVDEIYDFLAENEMDIYLVVFDTKSVLLGEKIYPQLEEYIDHNYVCDKREEEFGDRYVGFHRLADARGARSAPNKTTERPIARFLKSSAERMEAPSSDTHYVGEECCKYPQVDLSDVDNIEILEEKLAERIKHKSDSYSEYLLYLIARNGFTNAQVYKKAIVDKRVFAKIKNGSHPKKLTALQLCIGAELSMDDTRDLLARAGYALSPCDLTDIIFSFFIENGIYNMTELDIQLEEHGLPCII